MIVSDIQPTYSLSVLEPLLCDLLERLAVVDDGDHVLDVALRQLSVSQVILLVGNGLLFIPATQMHSLL